jgi:two-component system chemotaxis sensor kinase CheA
VRSGKAPEGRLRFHAFHQGGKVRVEITDDGRGIDLVRVKSKAIERGLITEGQARSMADEEAVRLVLAPGFSTAERITNLSGRGVGMDVVKRNIESIGGSVDLTSRPGEGTTVSMELPLTLAIVQAFIVQVGDERFALPAIHVREIVNVDPENPEHRLDSVAGTPVFHLRGVHLPLLDLRTTLELNQVESNGTLMADHRHIAVVQIHNRLLGFVVSRVIDIEEIVVKPMPAWLSHFSMYAGTTILGNGFPGLILDTMDLARRVELRLDVADALNAAGADDSEAEDGSESLLLVVIQGDRLAAIPMPQVERLVEAEPSSLIRKGEHLRLREAGELLPVADMTGRDPSSRDAPMSVVIAGLDGALVGIGVNDVLRVVSTVLDVQRDRERPDPMVMGTCLVDGDPIDVVDVEAAARHFGLRVQEPAVRIVPGRLR